MAAIADRIDVDGLAVTVRRSARARRMTLRVGRVDGAVTLTLPPAVALSEARAFARSHRRWIARQVAAAPSRHTVRVGGTVPFEGRALPVVAGRGRSAKFEGSVVVAPEDRTGPRVAALLKAVARDRLTEAAARHAAALGRPHGRITLRDPRSRWGSCSGRGDLMFSWRLVMAPPEVLDYVAAHEVAHLAHMDHSPRFWACLERLLPGQGTHRTWLRDHGAGLHAVVFGG